MRLVRPVAIALIALGCVGLWWSMFRDRDRSSEVAATSYNHASVVVVTIDTTRADRFGCYGSTAGLTPNIDALADEGILFEQAQAVAPVTLPSHTSMFTGLYPTHHGVRNNGTFSLGEEFETLAQTMSTQGYATGAFVSAQVLVKRYGLDAGFDVYDDDLSQGLKVGQTMVPSRRGTVTLAAATEWLDTISPDQPVFMWLHLYDPHAPYDPPPEFRHKFPADVYGAEIAFADQQVGKLVDTLKRLGRYDDTVITVIADHGESLGEHGEATHAILLHQGTIHVPWIVRPPGGIRPVRIAEPVSGVDLAPTLAHMTGVPVPNSDISDGRALFSRTEGPVEPDRDIYFEAMLPMYQYGWSDLRGLRQDDWEIIVGTRSELFNLARDPRELLDQAAAEPLQLEYLQQRIDRIIAADDTVDSDSRLEVRPSEREALAALGYVTTSTKPRRKPLDPRDKVSGHVNLEQSRALMASGRPDEALADIEKMLADDPENITALALKAQAFLVLGRSTEAEAVLAEILDLDSQNSEAVAALCGIEMQRRNYDRVIELAEIGRSTRSAFGVFDAWEARALLSMGQPDKAEDVVRTAMQSMPDDPDLLVVRATLDLRRGETEPAEIALRQAIATDPYHKPARNRLGQLLVESDRPQEAIAVYEDLLRISPGDSEALFTIGSILLQSNPVEALPYLEEAVRLAPGRTLNLTTLGIAYIQCNRFNEAEATLRRALDVDPDNHETLNNLGITLARQGKNDEAIRVFNSILEEQPEYIQARNNLAIALGESGHIQEAEREARKALARKPDYVDAMLTLAAALHHQNRQAEEAEVLANALRQMPDRTDIRIRTAVAFAGSGDCESAIPLLEAILAEKGTEPLPLDAHLAAGRCFEAAGSIDLALRQFEEAASRATTGPARDEATEGVKRLSLKLENKSSGGGV